MAKGQFSVTKKYSRSERFVDPLSSKTSVDSDNASTMKDKLGSLYTTSVNYLTLAGIALI